MDKTLLNNRGLQNTSCIRCRSVWSQHQYLHIKKIWTRYHWFTVSYLLLDEQSREFTLNAYSTSTSITDLTPDVDYSVSINSYYGLEESLPIFGQLTSKYIFHKEVCYIVWEKLCFKISSWNNNHFCRKCKYKVIVFKHSCSCVVV